MKISLLKISLIFTSVFLASCAGSSPYHGKINAGQVYMQPKATSTVNVKKSTANSSLDNMQKASKTVVQDEATMQGEVKTNPVLKDEKATNNAEKKNNSLSKTNNAIVGDNDNYDDGESNGVAHDPYEKFNRKIFSFNRGIDKVVLRPIAKVYDTVLPNPIQKGIHNFFSNINDVPTLACDLLQLEFKDALSDTSRMLVNSTVGLGGLIDMGTPLDLPKHHRDLGLTFARWGAKDSPYFVIPFLGPSTIRDFVALPIEYEFLTIWPYVEQKDLRYGLLGLDIIRIRDELLPTDKVIDQAFDPYVAVRNAYLQRRAYLTDKQRG
jgi:phospholipid-binding lipoprotein MlaA